MFSVHAGFVKAFFFVLKVELSSEEWQCKTGILRLNTSAFVFSQSSFNLI